MFKIPDHFVGVFEPGAAFLRVELCVAAMIQQAVKNGAELKSNHCVQTWDVDAEGLVTVNTDRGVYRGRKLVIAAGGWSEPLLGDLNLGLQLLHKQQQNPHSMTHTHRPKTILAILDGARTIDPNSVVDQHVALPQGVYGFVFRGRPVELYTTTNTSSNVIHSVERGIDNTEQQQGALIVPPGDTSSTDQGIKAAVVNTVFPKGKAII